MANNTYGSYKDYRTSDLYAEYVYGNTVRKMQAAPAYMPERAPQRPERAPQRPQRTPQQEQELRRKKAAAKKNRQRAKMMNGRYVLFLSAVTCLCALVAGLFVMMQADVTTNMKQIASLEAQISELKIANDAVEKRLDTTVNLEEIKEEALRLGMVYPSEEQIIEYSVEHTDYMNQYSDIP